MSVDNEINSIQEKLQLLIKQQIHLKKENEKVQQQLHLYIEKEKAAAQKIADLQQQVMVLKLAAVDMSEKDKKEFDKKLNQYIKEIDKCIAFLSQ